jgi:protein SCO1/2
MWINRTSIRILALGVVVASLGALAGCRRRSANEKRYELKGKVVAVEKDKRLVTIAHEEIKGYMSGMVMPFTIKDDWPFEIPLVPGDQINATLVVDGSTSWLEDVVIAKESTETGGKAPDGLAEPKPGDEVPNYLLTNQDGKNVRIKDYRGKALVLTFIYTRCPMPDQCTLMSNNFSIIDQELQKQPELYEKTHLLSVSFDPDYDTPKVLRSYGAAFTGRYSNETFQHWEFATGTKDEIKGLAQFFGLRYWHDTESGQEQIIHSLRTAVIGPDGKVFKVYRENKWKPEEVLRDLAAISLTPNSKN